MSAGHCKAWKCGIFKIIIYAYGWGDQFKGTSQYQQLKWRGARVDGRGDLEKRCGPSDHSGFESHPLRQAALKIYQRARWRDDKRYASKSAITWAAIWKLEIFFYVLQSLSGYIQSKLRLSDCLILVHPVPDRLAQIMLEILQPGDIPVVDIGRDLSAHLVEITRGEHKRAIQRWFDDMINLLKPRPVLCNHIDILFDPGFHLDPLPFFCQAARKTKLVVLWLGDLLNETLSYAVPEHSHYRTWRINAYNLSIYRIDDSGVADVL